MIRLIRASLIFSVALFLPMGLLAQVSESQVQQAHANAQPLDAHVDILLPTTSEVYLTDDGISQVTIDKLERGGMATITLAIQAPNRDDSAAGVADARKEMDAKVRRITDITVEYSDRIEIARSYADLVDIHAAGKVAVLLGFQNAYGLDGDINEVDRLARLGVRVFGFNHIGNNAFSDSSRPRVPGHELNGGLSDLGLEAVTRLNQFGIIVDVSQLTPAALMQAVEHSSAPVIASHSGVRALVDETRNLLDSEIDAIAAKGGVIHVPPFNTYIAPRPPEFVERLSAIRENHGLPRDFRGVLDDSNLLSSADYGAYMGEALYTVPRATLQDYLNHIDYVVDRVGIDHVGIGTDLDHGAGIIGYADASEAQNLTRALLERGYSASEVKKIWSGNFLRVLQEVEQLASP